MNSTFVQRRRTVGASLAVLSMALLAACSGGGTDEGANPNGGTPVPGGTLTVITETDGLTLDPTVTAGGAQSVGNVMLPIFDTLIRVDVNGEITPRIATSVESEDRQTWTIDLREGVTFTDGTPLDAEAVKFNWERAKEPTSPITQRDANTMTSITVTSPTTLEVVLNAPSSGFPFLLQGSLGMIGSPTAIKEMGEDYSVAPVGAGPFILDQRVPGSMYSYEKNPDFWEDGRPYIDTLNIKLIVETQQAEAAFKAGEGDLFYTGEPRVQRDLKAAGFEALTPDAFGGYQYTFNTTSAPTDDLRVRKAIVMALDPEDLSNRATQGAAAPWTTLFPETSPFHAPEYQWPFNGDMEEAQKLIDSYVAEHGPAELTYEAISSDRPWADAIAERVNSQLEGITITIGTVSLQKALDNLYSDQFVIANNSLQGFDPIPTLSNRLLCDSGGNNAHYCNEDMDRLLKQAAVTASQDERVELLGEVQGLLVEDLPFFLQMERKVELFVNDSAKGALIYDAGLIAYEGLWTDE